MISAASAARRCFDRGTHGLAGDVGLAEVPVVLVMPVAPAFDALFSQL